MSQARFPDVSGFVLAGGASTRMGEDKALLKLGGVPLILRTARLAAPLVGSVTVVGPPERYAALGLRVLPDREAGQGPLRGIATALAHTASDWNLVVACDLPYLTAAWLEHLVSRAVASSSAAVLPQSAAAGMLLPEPLCAMYHRRAGPAIEAALERGVRKVTDGLAGLRLDWIPPAEWKAFDSSGRLFKNVNAPEDFQQAQGDFAAKDE
jgi:molybdenum cofactor guanylyltransferase